MASNSFRRLPHSFRTHASKRFYSTTPPPQSDFMTGLQNNLSKVWAVTKKTLGPVGERLGSALGSYRQPVTYNLLVTRELLKQVYIAERLQPPHWTTFLNVYATLWSRVRNPVYLRELFSSGDWMKVAIYGLEGYGIFKIGEIVGRRSLVGYNVQ